MAMLAHPKAPVTEEVAEALHAHQPRPRTRLAGRISKQSLPLPMKTCKPNTTIPTNPERTYNQYRARRRRNNQDPEPAP